MSDAEVMALAQAQLSPQHGTRLDQLLAKQRWRRHFRWSQDRVFIIGRTATGRTTVVALHLHNMVAVKVRRNWGAAG